MTTPERIAEAANQICLERGFKFVELLGRGAFKSAFLIKAGDQQAALKLADAGNGADRLEREVQALRSCGHAHVATIHEAFFYQFQDMRLWVVIEEYLAGGTMEARLNHGMPSTEIVRHLGVRLADVLGHLYERSLVHRDIKPANILFRDGGNEPVLTDFGIVRMLDSPTLTADFAAMGPGTPRYAAPEQLTNEKYLIDWRTDQFGLAVVLAECLLGRHPFQANDSESVREAIIKVASKAALPTTSREELITAGFSSLVQALSVWPVSRFRRPADLILALQNN